MARKWLTAEGTVGGWAGRRCPVPASTPGEAGLRPRRQEGSLGGWSQPGQQVSDGHCDPSVSRTGVHPGLS